MTTYQLAQINIGTLKAPVNSPPIADFVASLDRINALAEGQPGFVWRLKGEGGDATDIAAFDNPLIAINMSVWSDLDALAGFVYRSQHRDVMRRRSEWFETMELFQCLWWVEIGHRPTPQEGIARLEILRRLGPSPEAFTFRAPFAAPGLAAPDAVLDECA